MTHPQLLSVDETVPGHWRGIGKAGEFELDLGTHVGEL
jgi:hypothetical protein